MAEGLKLYETDDATALTTLAITPAPTPAGSTSDTFAFHLWNDKGSPSGTFRRNGKLRLLVQIGAQWLETGDPLADKRELQLRITGSANPGADPLFVARTATGWLPIGNGVLFAFGDIRPDCAIYFELRYVPNIQGGSGDIVRNWRLEPITDQYAEPFASRETGVLTGCGEPAISEFDLAPTVLATGTPDDVVNLGPFHLIGLGVSRYVKAGTLTLNQNDSAAAALASGEAYEAVISAPLAGGAAVATKGVKATAGSTVLPAMPDGHKAIAHVHVAYQSGGTSVIADADITILCTNGRGRIAYSGASFDVTLAAVRALNGITRVDRPEGTLTLAPSVTSTIYLGTDGTWSTTATVSALAFWSVVTDGSGVTGVTDLRTFVGGRAIVLRMPGSETTGTAQDWATVPEPSSIDRIETSLRVASSGGATGNTVADINAEGTTLFTTSGLRPSIAAGSRVDSTAWPEVSTLAKGDALTLDTDTATTGGTQGVDLEAIVWLYGIPA